MTNPHDSIRVGSITLVYSSVRRGWLAPGGQVIQNPLKAQRVAEQLNSKKVQHERKIHPDLCGSALGIPRQGSRR
ncbi:DUF1317 family protein [Klebsiella pneumoniae]